jgi:hypothetical protein
MVAFARAILALSSPPSVGEPTAYYGEPVTLDTDSAKPAGEVPGHGYPDWPEEFTTFAERKAYQVGIAHARQIALAAAPDSQAKPEALLAIDHLIAKYHAEVWAAAEGETSCDYDMAGVDTAKQLRTAIAALVGMEASKSSAPDSQGAPQCPNCLGTTAPTALDPEWKGRCECQGAPKPVARSVTDDLMDLVDRLGSEVDQVDPLAWAHLIAYAPKPEPIGFISPDTLDKLQDPEWRALRNEPAMLWTTNEPPNRAIVPVYATIATPSAGAQAAGQDADDADMFWDWSDGESFGHSIEEILSGGYGPGDVVKIERAKRLPIITVRCLSADPDEPDEATYEVVDPKAAGQEDAS